MKPKKIHFLSTAQEEDEALLLEEMVQAMRDATLENNRANTKGG